MNEEESTQSIVLGGGCFWCIEAVLLMIEGVTDATSGYAGGESADPDYASVCRGMSGHAEVVKVYFDPGRVTLEEILDVFFAAHDPTSLNRQGADSGTQYRSIVLYDSDEQRERAQRFIDGIAPDYSKPIVTEVKELDRFCTAEDYHQRYFQKNPRQGYCQMVVAPKVEKIKTRLQSK
jgi:peptide-methionine (S)-S-oxide reductase